jgi:transcriptional regulator with XRE-family HTH domain
LTGFAERLKELRAQAKMTQAQLAETSGVSLGGVRDLEQGNRRPLLETAVKLAAALGVRCTAFEKAVKKPAGRLRKRKDSPKCTRSRRCNWKSENLYALRRRTDGQCTVLAAALHGARRES